VVTILLVCLLLALGFGFAWFHSRGASPALAVVAWLAYPPYEYWVQKNCTGECNIRVDLVLIALVLLVVSVLAVVSLVRGRRSRKKAGTEP
jgi:hypothetical protein